VSDAPDHTSFKTREVLMKPTPWVADEESPARGANLLLGAHCPTAQCGCSDPGAHTWGNPCTYHPWRLSGDLVTGDL
jgi:hypothetical protein